MSYEHPAYVKTSCLLITRWIVGPRPESVFAYPYRFPDCRVEHQTTNVRASGVLGLIYEHGLVWIPTMQEIAEQSMHILFDNMDDIRRIHQYCSSTSLQRPRRPCVLRIDAHWCTILVVDI